MKETEEEILWRLESYDIKNLIGRNISYIHKGFVLFLIDVIHNDIGIRQAVLDNIDRDNKCIKFHRQETGFSGWVPLKRLKIISMD